MVRRKQSMFLAFMMKMVLIIKSFRQVLRNQKDKDYKPHGKRACFKCGKIIHFIVNCPYNDNGKEEDKKRKKEVEKKNFFKKGGEAHIGK
jgi:hypothetical protein